jgi:hypothetical protein
VADGAAHPCLVAAGKADAAVAVAILGGNPDEGIHLDEAEQSGRIVEQRGLPRREIRPRFRRETGKQGGLHSLLIDQHARGEHLERGYARFADAAEPTKSVRPEALVTERLEAEDLPARRRIAHPVGVGIYLNARAVGRTGLRKARKLQARAHSRRPFRRLWYGKLRSRADAGRRVQRLEIGHGERGHDDEHEEKRKYDSKGTRLRQAHGSLLR